MRMRARHLSAVVTIVLASVALAGCSGSGSPDSGATSSTARGTDDQRNDEYDVRMATCMKQAGFDMDDPRIQSPDRPKAASDAFDSCTDDLGERPSTDKGGDPLSQAAGRAYAEEWTKCFEKLGYEVPRVDGEPSPTLPDGASDADYEQCDAAASKVSDAVWEKGGGKKLDY